MPPADPLITPVKLRENEERIRTGVALRPRLDEPVDALGRWLWRWLTPTEREIFQFVTDDFSTSLDRQWLVSLRIAVVGIAIGGCLPATLASWVVGFTVWISIGCLGAAVVNDSGGNGLRLWALYPLRFWDIARTALKTNLVLFVGWLPVPLVSGALLAIKWGAPATVGILFGGKAAMLILTLMPFIIPLHLTSYTNDSRSRHCATRFALLATLTFLLIIGSGLTFLFAPAIPPAVGLLVVLLVSGWFLRSYGRWYNRMRFDLMP